MLMKKPKPIVAQIFTGIAQCVGRLEAVG